MFYFRKLQTGASTYHIVQQHTIKGAANAVQRQNEKSFWSVCNSVIYKEKAPAEKKGLAAGETMLEMLKDSQHECTCNQVYYTALH